MNPNAPAHDPALDRVDALHQQQLSALIDGELAADQARFLIRRLEHDQELSACQERWQMAGDVLRGQLGAVAPADFAARVALALPPPVATPRRDLAARRSWQGWATGGALAAGLGLLAVMLMPAMLRPDVQAPATPVVVTAPESVSAPLPAASEATGTPAAAVAGPTSLLAVAEPVIASQPAPAARSRPAAAIRRTQPAAAMPSAGQEPAPAWQLAQQGEAAEPARSSPFALPSTELPARPWPRSQLSGADAWNVDTPAARSPFAPPAAGAAQWQR